MSSVSVGFELPDINMSNTLSEAAVMYAGTFVTREQNQNWKARKQKRQDETCWDFKIKL